MTNSEQLTKAIKEIRDDQVSVEACAEARGKIKFGKKKIDENGNEYLEELKQ